MLHPLRLVDRFRSAALLLRGAAAGVIVGALAGCATPVKAPPAPSEPPPHAYETFDAVWTTIDEQHFDPTHNGVDWVAIREEFRPQVAATRTNNDLRALLEAMIAKLGQSHFGIIPSEIASPVPSGGTKSDRESTTAHAAAPASSDTSAPANDQAGPSPHAVGDSGVLFRLVDGSIMTVAPRPGGPAATLGIEAGWILLEVDGRSTRDILPDPEALALAERDPAAASKVRYVAENIAATAAMTAPGESSTLVLRDRTGVNREVVLEADSFGGTVIKFGNLPPLETHVVDRWIDAQEFADAGLPNNPERIGYIGFNIWMLPAAAPIDAAVDRFRASDGIILDLRGNPGGVGGMAMGIGGHFFAEPANLGTMITRDGKLEFRVNPRRATADGRAVEPFAGPIAILIDPLTASTSEIFAAGLQEQGRARVFGQRSAGAALPSIATLLPNGDVLQYAMADFVTPQGNRIEGHGVLPDSPVELSRAALREEPDPVLAAALRWITTERWQRANPAS